MGCEIVERDFRYLRDVHGDAGAREIFEKICTEWLYAQYGENAHNIRVCQGDAGIDILVGDFSAPIKNYQCKFFLDGIGDAQKAQIRDSFNTAVTSSDYTMEQWILCVPCALSAPEFKWWSGWCARQKKLYGIDIALHEGGYLISQLKKYDIYTSAFDDDVRIKLDTILSYFGEEKRKIHEEIIVMLNELDVEQYNDSIFVKKLENANIVLLEGCKRDFFNAELVEHTVQSKGDPENIRLLNNLKQKVYSLWETQYRRYSDDSDGNELLSRTYERIEDTDTTTLACPAIPEVSLFSKKGMLHQWAEECSIGWLKDYKQKLEVYLAKEAEQHGN